MYWLGAVCAADSDYNSVQALDCSQASCLCIKPGHTLQPWPHWASIAAVIQPPGREACTASQADNNQPGLENSSSLLLVSAVYLSLSLLAEPRASGGPLCGTVPGRTELFLESIFCCCKQFWICLWHVWGQDLWLFKTTYDLNLGQTLRVNIDAGISSFLFFTFSIGPSFGRLCWK